MIYVLATALLLLAPQADSTRLAWVPNPRSANGGWVSDSRHHLAAATVAEVNNIISTLERETTAEIAVVVLDSLDGLTPHDAAFLLHRRWGVGKASRDNGIVLLWSPLLRRIYVSVGYGLEGVLPDARAGRIQRDSIVPFFAKEKYDEGTLAGVRALASAAREENYAGPARVQSARPARALSPARPPVGFWLLAALAVIAGAIGTRLWWRYHPRRCPNGHGWMRRLNETEDDLIIGREGALEERLGSMDYDVWLCDTCQARAVSVHRKWFSRYQECPKCKRRTLDHTEKTLVGATATREGLVEVTRTCRNPECDFSDTRRRAIPKVVVTSGSSGSSGGGGGGGFGDGGSSFGGGSSGGGGAGSGY